MESTFVEEPTPEEEVEILRGMLWEANLSKRLQEESFGTTELRAIQDIIRTIGYPDGTAALSEHVRPVVGAHPDAVLGRVRLAPPYRRLPPGESHPPVRTCQPHRPRQEPDAPGSQEDTSGIPVELARSRSCPRPRSARQRHDVWRRQRRRRWR